MLYNFFIDVKEPWSNRYMFLPTNAENKIDRTCEQLGSFNENKNYKETEVYNQKAGQADISDLHNKESA